MTEQSNPLIHAKMAAITKDAGHIGKDKRNQQQGFNYRGIDDVYNALHHLFGEHGVYMTTEVLDRHREERTTPKGGVLAFTVCRIKFTWWAADGSSTHSIIDGEGMDSGDKSTNKALSVAQKYALLQAFLIPTQEMVDPDAETHEVAQRDGKPANQGKKQQTQAEKAKRYAEAAKDRMVKAVDLSDLAQVAKDADEPIRKLSSKTADWVKSQFQVRAVEMARGRIEAAETLGAVSEIYQESAQAVQPVSTEAHEKIVHIIDAKRLEMSDEARTETEEEAPA